MERRDLIINGVLIVLIGVVTYFLVTFKEAEIQTPQWVAQGTPTPEVGVGPESPFGPRPVSANELAFVRTNPLRTIIPTPTPPPRTPTPTPPPPPLDQTMNQNFQLVMPDPPNSVMLQNKRTNEMVTWKVGETKAVPAAGNRELEVKLIRVDSNDFSVHFTAPPDQTFAFKFFQ